MCPLLSANKRRKNTTLQTVRTVQILSAVDKEVVLSPHVDHGWVFLQQDRVGILKHSHTQY